MVWISTYIYSIISYSYIGCYLFFLTLSFLCFVLLLTKKRRLKWESSTMWCTCVILLFESLRNVVEIKVKLDCDGCERRVRNSVAHIKGVKSVEINRKINKITVTGNVEPKRVLHKVKNTGKFAEFWPFVPYEVVSYPYAAGVYNKKAPSGFVRNAPAAYSTGTDSLHDKYVQMFSDDNPNASCSIM
ncbi:heavy metal-associated isoprenylated plant protein 20-like isoform X2 [Amaranthus tricolor]|uniref:heavy metal-associated isoprenylated plant protein 20-like isoform X2 n=1 Tax=Amaranthus tricolor TaxID=29722 RepID=UPI00258F6870|nr:heavy metal-associated isoprenylated plant protein 20-like isoform X2 [Amaranthus tricolor]